MYVYYITLYSYFKFQGPLSNIWLVVYFLDIFLLPEDSREAVGSQRVSDSATFTIKAEIEAGRRNHGESFSSDNGNILTFVSPLSVTMGRPVREFMPLIADREDQQYPMSSYITHWPAFSYFWLHPWLCASPSLKFPIFLCCHSLFLSILGPYSRIVPPGLSFAKPPPCYCLRLGLFPHPGTECF